MKNLKKVLALVMAFAMAFTMMASAAYTDQADIVAVEAVDTLSALGVINGYEDGSFKPNGTVTRAEMAAMIYIIRNGGKTDASSFAGTQTTFKDVPADAWYAGYVKFCQSMNIISGRSAEVFDPNATVTGVEAALMCLRTMGYSAEKSDIGGSTWSITTIGLASENGILDDVNTPMNAACPRQWAAQMLFNMIDAETVKWSADKEDYLEYETVGEKYLELVKDEPTLLTEIIYDDVKDTYGLLGYTKIEKDYSDLIGQNVRVLHKKGKTDKVYGVFADKDSKVITEALIGDIEDLDQITNSTDKVKIDGTEYKLEKVTGYFFNNGKIADVNDVAASKAFSFKAIDNDGDNKIDTVVVFPFTVEKVSYINNTKFSTTVNGQKGTFSADKLEDVDYYSDMAKDDYVVVTAAANTVKDTAVIEKADVVKGKIDGKKDDSVRVGGTWYDAGVANVFNGKNNGSTVEMAVVNGYAFTCEVSSESVATSDVVYLEKFAVEEVSSGLDAGKKVMGKIVDAEGKIVKAEISKINDLEIVDKAKAGDDEITIENAVGYTKVVDEKDVFVPGEIVVGLYSFDKDGDKYELTALNADNKAGFKAYSESATAYVKDDATLGAYNIADDSIFFVKADDEDDTKVVTGKALKAWGDKTFATSKVLTLESSGKFQTVAVGALTLNALPADGDTLYGYVVSDSYTTKVDGTTYYNFTVFVDGADKDVICKNNVSKGDMIAFNMKGETEVELANVELTAGAVQAATATRVQIGNNTYKITDDTVIVYVDTEDVVGVEGGSITLAQETENNTYINNVKYNVDDDEIVVIFVATNGEL